MINHIIAAMHMLDAYDSGKEWDCTCPDCVETSKNPFLVKGMREELQKHPPNPKAPKTPPIAKIPLD